MSDFLFRYHNFPKKLSHGIIRKKFEPIFVEAEYRYVHLIIPNYVDKYHPLYCDLFATINSKSVTLGYGEMSECFVDKIKKQTYETPDTLDDFKQLLIKEIKLVKMKLL